MSDPWIWWKHGVIYHIYPRSFMDSNGDGIGDLNGITQKLPYLSELGVDAVWLSPVYLSPGVDFGYDVSDYLQIDPIYGTIEDFRNLIDIAHKFNIRIISDMILNHTSDQHAWFMESRSSKENAKRNWYIWKDGNKGKPPNNWKSVAGGSAWQFDENTNQFYYHSFFKEQPDLNWRNPELKDAFFEQLKYWLDFGVDGFRLDVINLIVKDKKFRDNPYFFKIPIFQQHIYTRNRRKSHAVIKDLRKLTDDYGNKTLVGEIYTEPPGNSSVAARYLDKGTGLHMAFDFSLIFQYWSALKYFRCIQKWYRNIPTEGWPCSVLSNHDLFRSIDRIPWRFHKEAKAKVAAVLLLTLRGTPFIYYGEEIGMRNARIPREKIMDPFGKKYWPFFTGRDKARTPMQWNSGINSGFSSGYPWLPVNADYSERNVELQCSQPDSLLNIYKTLIKLRRKLPSLQKGIWNPLLTGKRGILAYSRNYQEERTYIFLNFTSRIKRVALPVHSYGYVVFSTHKYCGNIHYFNEMKLKPYEATVFSGKCLSGSLEKENLIIS